MERMTPSDRKTVVDTWYFAPSALGRLADFEPRALPWAITFRAFGASLLNISISYHRRRLRMRGLAFCFFPLTESHRESFDHVKDRRNQENAQATGCEHSHDDHRTQDAPPR